MTPESGQPGPSPPSHRARLPGAILALFGAAIGLEAMTFNVYFMTDPVGPKALPLLAAFVCLGVGAWTAFRPGPRAGQRFASGSGPRLAAAAAAFVGYAYALPVLGFFFTTTLVVAALSVLFGAPRRRAILAAASLAGCLWLLFVPVLNLPLPIGSLWIR